MAFDPDAIECRAQELAQLEGDPILTHEHIRRYHADPTRCHDYAFGIAVALRTAALAAWRRPPCAN